MPPLEEYLERADELAQHVVETWGINVQSGNAAFLTQSKAFLSTKFKVLVDKACLYRNARRLADNHREYNVLSEEDEAEEKAAREAFALAYEAYYERHATMS
jgi:DNA-binding SARP family transcriptional activator